MVGRAVLGMILVDPSLAQLTERVSLDSSGSQSEFGADLPQSPGPCVSRLGEHVVFMSRSDDLVSGDLNGKWDVFLRDRYSGRTELVSIATGGGLGNGNSGLWGIAVSSDGRFVAFESRASNLAAGDANGFGDVYIRDRLRGRTDLVSVGVNGVSGNRASDYPSISSDGRYVGFSSEATDLVPGDVNGVYDVFLRDCISGHTELISVTLNGTQANGDSHYPSVSSDARYVAFISSASNLVAGDTNGFYDIFVFDRQSLTTERVSVATGGVQGNHQSLEPAVSSDGRFVAYMSSATNLVAGDTNGSSDVFLHDRRQGTTERISVSTGSGQADGGSWHPSFSTDGRYVAFQSSSRNLIPGGTIGINIFVRDVWLGRTEIVSVLTGGAQVINSGLSSTPSISGDGRSVVFMSYNRDLVDGDTNASADVFLHDREATGFSSLCDPGALGVVPCPCSNPPSTSGRGCENSSNTGGATLSATGIAYLSVDSLTFTTSGEVSTALSILVQGQGELASGVPYGQGVRCTTGGLLRLYVKNASAGSITVPDFSAGDATISERSALRGDLIRPGESLWYLVYYRDAIVLGGCPASSMFNATQTGRVTWSL